MIFENNDRLVFAGDSVTDMGSTSPVGDGFLDQLGRGYVLMVQTMLAAWYPERNIRVTNSGISGNTSRDLRARFQRDVVYLHPQWVSICIGINDVWRQFDCPAVPELAVLPEEYEANIEAMILAVKDTTKGIFLVTPYYIEPNPADLVRARIDEYCAICRRLAEKYGCIFVDFQAMFAEFCRYQHSCRLAWDRVHPNEIGATLMAKTFLSHCGFEFGR